MTRSKLVFAPLAVLALALPARADTVVLEDGRKVEGRVSQDGDEVVIKRQHGEVRFKRTQVLRIDKGNDVWSELERKQQELGNGTADERYQLGVWCREHSMDDEARAAFLSVLKLDPDNAGARAGLGYVKGDDGRWISEDDAMKAKGLVKLDGKWMTPAEKSKIEADRDEKREKAKKAEEEAAAKRHEKYEAEHQARLARIAAYEEELAKARARARAQEDYDDRMIASTQWSYFSGPVFPSGFYYGPYYRYSVGPNVGTQEAIYLAGIARTGRYPRNFRWPTYRTVTVVNPWWGSYGDGFYIDDSSPFGGGGFYSSSSYSSGGFFGGSWGGSSSSYSGGTFSDSSYSFGLGLSASGSWTSRSGRSQIRFRLGY